MTRRALGALLWFMTIWFGWDIVWSVTGVPREIGPVLAAIAAAFVAIDPTGKVWRRVTPSILPKQARPSTLAADAR